MIRFRFISWEFCDMLQPVAMNALSSEWKRADFWLSPWSYPSLYLAFSPRVSGFYTPIDMKFDISFYSYRDAIPPFVIFPVILFRCTWAMFSSRNGKRSLDLVFDMVLLSSLRPEWRFLSFLLNIDWTSYLWSIDVLGISWLLRLIYSNDLSTWVLGGY